MRHEHANPPQFLVGEVRLFLIASAFYVAKSRFLRDTAQLRFRYAEQEGNSCQRDIFRDLIAHNLPLCRNDGHGFFFRSQDHRLVNVDVGRSLHLHEPPLTKVRPASVPVQFGNRGDRGGGPVHGGGPLLSLQHSQLPNDFNPVNSAFPLSEMPQNYVQANLLGVVSGLDQTAANGVAHQTRCFVDIKFLHKSCSVRFCGFYTNSQVHSDVFRGLSFTN